MTIHPCFRRAPWLALVLLVACSGGEAPKQCPTACPLGERCVQGTCVEAECVVDADCAEGVCIDLRCQSGGCEVDGDCADGERCVGGACVGCASRLDCEPGEICRSGLCGGCTAHEDCLETELCEGGLCTLAPPPGCDENDDCDDGLICVGGTCTGCSVDDDCAGDLCVQGRCVSCESSADCESGEVCVDGECGPCASAADCAPGQACVAGLCGACESANDCRTGEVCRDDRCAACLSADECGTGLGCVDESCAACRDASHCRPGELCDAGTCRGCESRDECSEGLICLSGRCSPCTSAGQCAAGEVCSGGACGACKSGADCPSALGCVNGACEACTATTQCGPGLICHATGACGGCFSNEQCASGEVCVDGTCGACSSSTQCASGEVCVGGSCGACTSATQCDPGQGCVDGGCRYCSSDAHCANGQICRSGQCRACAADAECPGGTSCLSGVCRSCASNSECAAPLTCGGGGVGGVCGCTPKACGDVGAKCGTVTDGCGGTITCAACPTVHTRVMLLSERFFRGTSPTGMPVTDYAPDNGLPSAAPNALVALAGESEGYQLAFNRALADDYTAEFAPSTTGWIAQHGELLRIGFVDVVATSQGVGRGNRQYPDPLPPLVPGHAKGALRVEANRWGGFVVLVHVPQDTAQGVYEGQVQVKDSGGTVRVTSNFTIDVRRVKGISGVTAMPPPGTPEHLRTLFGYDPFRHQTTVRELYGEHHGTSPTAIPPGWNAGLQTRNTLEFFARHRITPTNFNLAFPLEDGSYGTCTQGGANPTYDAGANLREFVRAPWYLDSGASDSRWGMKLLPDDRPRHCGAPAPTLTFDENGGLITGAGNFIQKSYDFWSTHGLLRGRGSHSNTYFRSYDEPSQTQASPGGPVVQLNKLVHRLTTGVKTLVTLNPKGEAFGAANNLHLWNLAVDGDRENHIDTWGIMEMHRWGYYGDRMQETKALVERMKGQGREIWQYNIFRPVPAVPQLTVDGPVSDWRMLLWHVAYLGDTGWLVATTNRWYDDPNLGMCLTAAQQAAIGAARLDNPWDNPMTWTSFPNPAGGVHAECSNGWGSLYYPPYRPEQGLEDVNAAPVSSLRLQNIRQGIEDANTIALYRTRYPQLIDRRFEGVFGALQTVTTDPRLGRFTFPTYTATIHNGGVSVRMEQQRRLMVRALSL